MRDDETGKKPSAEGGIGSALFLCAVAVVLVIGLALAASMLQRDQAAMRAQAPVDGLTTGSVKGWDH